MSEPETANLARGWRNISLAQVWRLRGEQTAQDCEENVFFLAAFVARLWLRGQNTYQHLYLLGSSEQMTCCTVSWQLYALTAATLPCN